MEFLLGKISNPFQVDAFSESPLHAACTADSSKSLELLLLHTPYASEALHMQGDQSGSPLYCTIVHTCRSTSPETEKAQLLLEAGADPNQTGLGQPMGSALAVAVAGGNHDLCMLLIRHGARLDIPTGRYRDILGLASALERSDFLEGVAPSQGRKLISSAKPTERLV
jgi:ankyrin repeat protein